MGLFSRKKPENLSAQPTTSATPRPGSDETTPAASTAPSVLDREKADPAATGVVNSTEARSPSRDDENALEKRIDSLGAEGEHPEEDGIEYPGGLQLALITIALCLSVFCMALDNTIISTAIPRITDEFKAIDDVGCECSDLVCTTITY